MSIIKIAYSVPPATFEQIKDMLDNEVLSNHTLADSGYSIERDTATSISCKQGQYLELLKVFHKIQLLLDARLSDLSQARSTLRSIEASENNGYGE